MSEIRAIGDRTNNAELMRDCAALGYINGRVLDMTYGQGRFWKLYCPNHMLTNDIDVSTEAHFNADFRHLQPIWVEWFDTVVLDGPYKLNGTGGSHPSDAGYGVANKGSIEGRMSLILDGIDEGLRVLAPGGHLLVKCQDQVCSGKKVWQTIWIVNHVHDYNGSACLVDQLHVQSYRPQPAGRRQLHSRGDYSTLLVFRKQP